jgi:hypothetical protein
MALCLRSLLLALFVGAGLLEALLDLYFGLPLSFLPNTTETIQASVRGGTMSAHYQALSYKALHLFAELFYASSHTLANEHVTDSLHGHLQRAQGGRRHRTPQVAGRPSEYQPTNQPTNPLTCSFCVM